MFAFLPVYVLSLKKVFSSFDTVAIDRPYTELIVYFSNFMPISVFSFVAKTLIYCLIPFSFIYLKSRSTFNILARVAIMGLDSNSYHTKVALVTREFPG